MGVEGGTGGGAKSLDKSLSDHSLPFSGFLCYNTRNPELQTFVSPLISVSFFAAASLRIG